MKNLLIILILFICPLNSKSQELKFVEHSTWKSIIEEAKRTNKYIFVDAFATWCVPCKEMDSKVYTSDSVIQYFEDKFISVKLQLDQTEKDNEFAKSMYLDVKQKIIDYKITAVPTFLFFSPNGDIVTKGSGYKNVKELINLGKSALNSSTQYYKILKSYVPGKLPIDQLRLIAEKAALFGEKDAADRIAEEYIDKYLLELDKKELMTKNNLSFMGKFIGNTNTKAFNFFLNNIDEVNSTLGSDIGKYRIKAAINSDLFPTGRKIESSKQWDSITKVASKFGELGNEVVWGNRMMNCLNERKWADFGKYYVLYFKTALKRPDYNINNISFELFKYVEDKAVLSYACNVVMKYAMEEWYQNDAAAYDTYAQLLYKISRKDEALIWQERAVKLKQGAPDLKLYTDKLIKMKLGEPTWIVYTR